MTLADRRLHMIGIGGVGMSALAVIAYAWGADVSGCDRTPSEYSLRLRRFGVDVSEGHDRAHLEAGMEVVVSSAVPDELDELAAASELGLRVIHRGRLLAELVALKRSICVSGAHGKTTTTAMIAFAADRLGLDPTWLVGGEVPQLGGNAGPGGGELLIAEGDESDGSCALLRPMVAVVTNIDLDHHARYASVHDVERLFADWIGHVPAGGAVVLGDGVSLPAGAAPVARFGFDDGADWRISGFRSGPDGSRFWLSVPGELPVDVTLRLPGAHNARNAAGAIAALAAAGAGAADAAAGLAEFTGVGRRFEVRGHVDGATVVDDYAHNPAKVAAVIDAARTYAPARVVVCFQPHLYSRTAASAYEFGRALAGADEVVVTEIYPARERPQLGVTAKLVVDAVSERRPGMPLAYMPALGDAAAYLRGSLREGDLVLTVGAGDVRSVGDELLR
jgi:UDP-N-acetylmuramate--alanine ligase